MNALSRLGTMTIGFMVAIAFFCTAVASFGITLLGLVGFFGGAPDLGYPVSAFVGMMVCGAISTISTLKTGLDLM